MESTETQANLPLPGHEFGALRRAYDFVMQQLVLAHEASNVTVAARHIARAQYPDDHPIWREEHWDMFVGKGRHIRRFLTRAGSDPQHMPSRATRSRTCDKCGQDHPFTLMVYFTDLDEYVCPQCCTDNQVHDLFYDSRTGTWYEPEPDYERETILNDYAANPIRVLHRMYVAEPGEKIGPKTRFFGCEIEFATKHQNQLDQIVENNSNPIGIYKYDGSLEYTYAAEFCTLPLTMKAAQVQLKPVLDSMVEEGARAWNRTKCGLHVHVSRESASWLTWGKVDRFFRNDHNQALLDVIAGRQANSYCQRFTVSGEDATQAVPVKMARQKAFQGGYGGRPFLDRYTALNFSTGSKPTVEFRLFRGNVAHRGVMRAIEFCDSVVNWADAESHSSPMHYGTFLAWLKPRAQSYPNLVKLLRGKDAMELDTAA